MEVEEEEEEEESEESLSPPFPPRTSSSSSSSSSEESGPPRRGGILLGALAVVAVLVVVDALGDNPPPLPGVGEGALRLLLPPLGVGLRAEREAALPLLLGSGRGTERLRWRVV